MSNAMTDQSGRAIEGFNTIIFDCDSTLASIEGIDELAGDLLSEIQALTNAAMRGEVPLEEVYGRRLEMIRPTREQVEDLSRQYVEALVADARETVAALIWLGKDVRVISGGLLPPVLALARELGIPGDAVAAVDIDFDEEGAYRDFERDSPLARSGGKEDVLRNWSIARPSLLVGDGATDLEARPVVDFFAAYMGVAFRAHVAAHADAVLRAESLAPILRLAASEQECERLRDSRFREVLERGDALLRNPA